MKKQFYTKKFSKDLQRIMDSGRGTQKLKTLMSLLLREEPLMPQYRDHKLLGTYQGRRECHVEFDWLLIYKKTNEHIIFERTGSHSQLF